MIGPPKSPESHGSEHGPLEPVAVTPEGRLVPGTSATPAVVPASLTTTACALEAVRSETTNINTMSE